MGSQDGSENFKQLLVKRGMAMKLQRSAVGDLAMRGGKRKNEQCQRSPSEGDLPMVNKSILVVDRRRTNPKQSATWVTLGGWLNPQNNEYIYI
jgi:hypothetical protein